MRSLMIVLFACTLAATVAGYVVGRLATAAERRRLPLVLCRLHRATAHLRASVTAARSPLTKESHHVESDPRRPRS
jgi:hypothetical protein